MMNPTELLEVEDSQQAQYPSSRRWKDNHQSTRHDASLKSSKSFAELMQLDEEGENENKDVTANLKFQIRPDFLRFISYLSFWFMSLFATSLTTFIAGPRLLEGPEEVGNTCPPFDTGEGFDIKEDSHLIRSFGFNNICSNWDYSPSRELTAMVYPLFEYTLLLYLVADYASVAIYYKKGWVTKRFWKVFRMLFPLMIILTSWFRMIFVIIAYVDVSGHTAGFLGLQLVLIMVACTNVWFLTETKIEYAVLGGLRGTRIAAFTYLVLNLAISIVKVYLSAAVVFGAGYPDWARAPIGDSGIAGGQIVDYIWMLFNAIMPVIISFIRYRKDPPLDIEIDITEPLHSFVEIPEEYGPKSTESDTKNDDV